MREGAVDYFEEAIEDVEGFYILEDYVTPEPISPLSQEELNKLSVVPLGAEDGPTSPMGTALSQRKHSKTRVADSEKLFWSNLMPQEELDGYGIECMEESSMPAGDIAMFVPGLKRKLRTSYSAPPAIGQTNPLEIDDDEEEVEETDSPKSPMSKALKQKDMFLSLLQEAPFEVDIEEGTRGNRMEADFDSTVTQISRRKKQIAALKKSGTSDLTGYHPLFEAPDDTEPAEDEVESPMSKALRRKAIFKQEQENQVEESAECESPTSTHLLRRKKQKQLVSKKPLHEPNLSDHAACTFEESKNDLLSEGIPTQQE